ncbi:efflux RND transporter periplasmic adaptor subunit [Geofilum sp. OHC36d9]|uniref:efflux RND transporter periplasmic adaptor subunit n=1 Tax=Geofilum sp. OHC36d9 TaxID=3458413 RepID=UPI00403436A7
MRPTKTGIAIIAIATLMACNNKQDNNHNEEQHHHDEEGVVILNQQQRDALKLKTGTFEMRNLTTVVKSNGQLVVAPSDKADITAVIGGNVKEIDVFHGDKVRKGQQLALLEHPDYITLQEQFSETANRLDFLKQEYERQKELFDNNVGAGRDFQQARMEYNIAKTKYEGLKSRLELLNISPDNVMAGKISSTIPIYSPLNGFVSEVNIKLGTYVDAKDKLFAVSDNSAIHADFMVYEKDVHLLSVGQKIHFTVANRPEEELLATIFAIGKEFDANLRAVHVHAKIDKNVPGLIPGMYLSGHIHTDEKYTRTLPNDAIVTEGIKSYIFTSDPEAVTHHEHDETDREADSNNPLAYKMVEVIPGIKDDGYTEINLITPLPENTQIVLNAAYYLLADMKKEETEHEH